LPIVTVAVPLVVAVVGATATGKSDLAVELALRLGGEVVNADSMQLYRGMDVGTAKLTEAERRGVPHHLLDVWDVRVAANVADYQRLVRPQLLEIAARGRPAVLVGGSGLYVRAALDDLAFPGTDDAVRARLEAELVEVGPAVLHGRLAALDPAAAAAILPSNGRRVVRALEVVEITGASFTAALPEPGAYAVPAVQLGLALDRATLDARIESRVERMWAAGLVEEVSRLAEAGLRDGRTAARALGYAQVLRHLDGEWTEQEARAETVRATRRFARRQESWFRRDPRVHWLDAGSPDLVERALAGAGSPPGTSQGMSVSPDSW
jgi:tRNA dimethylallyltransferase